MTTTPEKYGAIGDGTSHPLSDFFPTLAAAQNVWTHADSLTNEIDWCACQAAVNAAKAVGGVLTLTSGKNYILGDKSLFCGRTNNTNKFLYGIEGNNAILTGSGTGNVVVDWIGALFHYMSDVRIVGDADDPPDIGILTARLDPSVTGGAIRSVGQAEFSRLRVEGSFNYATVFNHQSEGNFFNRCYFANSSGKFVYYHTNENPDSVTSPNATISATKSTNTFCHFWGCNFNHLADPAPSGYAAVRLASIQSISFTGCLFHDNDETGRLVLIETETDASERIVFDKSTFHGGYTYAIEIVSTTIDEFVVRSCRMSASSTADIKATGTVILDSPYIEARTVDLSSTGSQIRDGGLVRIADSQGSPSLSVNNYIACRVECSQSDTLSLPAGASNLAEIYYVD